MSRSAGPGSPVFFLCARLRRVWPRDSYDLSRHVVTRTGRVRQYRAPKHSALGQRSMTTAHEYVCTCGHRGWTNHRDILRHPRVGAEQ